MKLTRIMLFLSSKAMVMKAGGRSGVLFLLITILVTSCGRNRYKADVSDIECDISITRLERDLFDSDPSLIPASVEKISERYGYFFNLFGYVINAGDTSDPGFTENLVAFCTDKLNNEVYRKVMEKYSDLNDLEKELSDAFRHYMFYFPGKDVPKVYSCITGFNNSLIVSDSIMGISLDRYLGSDCEYYRQLQIYSYISARMNPENIAPDCMYAWGATEWDFDELGYKSDNVFARIIHEGKIKYFQKCMMPEIADTLLFGFNESQMTFCENNEMQMWQYLVENDLLFSTDQFIVKKLTGEAPFTGYFSAESPGRAAVWTGFRIVEAYMIRNNNVSLAEMMADTDFQGMLEGARYNPR